MSQKSIPQVKYSNTRNTELKTLKITQNTFAHCVLNVSSVSRSWHYLLSATHQKCNFPKRNYQC